MNWILRLLATAAATAVAVWLVPGITVTAPDTTGKVVTLIVVAAIFGLVNSVVKPIFATLTGCLIILSLGLFLLVINALMLMLTSWLAQNIGFGFDVAGFWPALLGSIVISLVSGLLSAFLPEKDKRRA
ncbi:phage holin family protein [Mariniluteicoccus endophyticus]